MGENRTSQRMEVGYEAFIEAGEKIMTSTCRDISPLGIGLYTGERVDIGSAVSMKLVLSESALIMDLKGTVRHCTDNPAGKGDAAALFLVGIEFDQETRDNFSFLDIKGDVMGRDTSHTRTIEAPAARCYHLIQDFDRYPEWTRILEGHRVLESYPDGRPRLVEWSINAYIRKIHLTQVYSYDDENLTLSWSGTSGDLVENQGKWKFQPRGEDQCFASLQIKAAIDFPAPSRLIYHFSNIVMRKSISDFGKFVMKNK